MGQVQLDVGSEILVILYFVGQKSEVGFSAIDTSNNTTFANFKIYEN